MTTAARVKQYRQLVKETAAQLREQPDSEIVRHLTSFKMLRQSLEARMLLGQHVDPADLLKIDEVLKQYLPQGAPIGVTLTIAAKADVTCPSCQHRFNPHTNATVAPPEPPPPAARSLPQPEAQQDQRSPHAHSMPKHEPAPNVVELPARRGVSTSAFNDQPGVPLRKLQPSIDQPFNGGSDHIW
jgi:hypothetical protein